MKEIEDYINFATMIKNIYFKMDTIGYHMFINLLVYHTKIISSNIGKFF